MPEDAIFAAQKTYIMQNMPKGGNSSKPTVLPFMKAKDFKSATMAFHSYCTDVHKKQVIKFMEAKKLKQLSWTKKALGKMDLIEFSRALKVFEDKFTPKPSMADVGD